LSAVPLPLGVKITLGQHVGKRRPRERWTFPIMVPMSGRARWDSHGKPEWA